MTERIGTTAQLANLIDTDHAWASTLLELTPAGDWEGFDDYAVAGKFPVARALLAAFSAVAVRRAAVEDQARRCSSLAAEVFTGELDSARRLGAQAAELSECAAVLRSAQSEALGLARAWGMAVQA